MRKGMKKRTEKVASARAVTPPEMVTKCPWRVDTWCMLPNSRGACYPDAVCEKALSDAIRSPMFPHTYSD